MPIYEFRCQRCDKQFEMLVRGQSQPKCPACESTELERLLSLPATQTETTHALAMNAARRRDKAQGTERMNEQIRYERSHND